MTILYLGSNLFFKGGIARYCRYQVQALRDAFGPQNVHAVALRGRSAGDFEEPFDVAWAPSNDGAPDRRGFALASARLAFTTRPDLIWTGHLHLGPGARRLARLTGARLVQNVYGRELWDGEMTAARRRALHASDLVVSDCHNSADYALAHGLVAAPPSVVWDCVDLARFSPGPTAGDEARLGRYGVTRTPGRFRLVFLGRLHVSTRYKGTERLVDLLGRLPESVEAVFAGDGDDIGHLRALADARGVGERVLFTGSVAEADLAAVLRSGDAFYLVSHVGHAQGEGIPLTPLEALGTGVPVLVGNQDGSRETLEAPAGDEPVGGWCGDPEDVEAQAAFVSRMMRDPARHAAEQVAARQRAEAAFGYPAFVDQTAAAVQRACE